MTGKKGTWIVAIESELGEEKREIEGVVLSYCILTVRISLHQGI